MGLEFRGPYRKPYFYSGVRIGDRVRRRYIAAGNAALNAAAEAKSVRDREATSRRADKARAAAHQALLACLSEQESLLQQLRSCYAAAAGWRLHHRQWREPQK